MIDITAVHMAGGTQHEHIADVQWREPSSGKTGSNTRAEMVTWIRDKRGDARVTDGRTEVALGVVDATPSYIHEAALRTDSLHSGPRLSILPTLANTHEENLMPARKMSADHKAALAKGRSQASAVRAYLDALESNHPKRGRKRTPESIQKRLVAIDAQYELAGSLAALQLLQERKNLEAELAVLTADDGVDLDRLRKAFVKNAKGYGEAKGIAYGTWREIGVPTDVLRDAGITRSS